MTKTEFPRNRHLLQSVMALSLNRERNTERIIIGRVDQVSNRMTGIMDAEVFYDQERPLGTFLFEHEKQRVGPWNENILTLSEGLAFPISRKKKEDTALAFLESEWETAESVRVFAAYQCWYWYQNYRDQKWQGDKGNKYADQMEDLVRSFSKKLWEDPKCTVEKAWESVQVSIRRTGTLQDSKVEIWYPDKFREREWLIVSYSFYPALQYYLKQIQQWNICVRRCDHCGKLFLAPSRHYSLCSELCKKAKNRKNKQEYDDRARKNGYDIDYKNTCQRMRNCLSKMKKQSSISEEKQIQAMAIFEAFRSEALAKKKKIRSDAEYRQFQNWLFEKERELEKYLNELSARKS